MKNIKIKIGDVVAIPLPNSKYAFGKIFKDSSIGIFSLISNKIVSLEELVGVPIEFFSGIFDTAIIDGSWPKIGNVPFASENDSWPPAQYIQDILNPTKFRIYQFGEMKPINQEELIGLEKQVMRKPEQLIGEICSRMERQKC